MPIEGLKKELLVEFIGTFFVTYTFATAPQYQSNLTTGFMMMILIYLFKDISGAGFNPAISTVQWLMGRLGEGWKDWKRPLPYIGVQFGAALAAAILGYTTRPDDGYVACVGKDSYFNIVEAFLNEYIWSTLLCFVVIVMQYSKETEDNTVYGFCIGLTYVAAGVSAPISGGGYNPALAFGLWFSSSFAKPSGNSCFEDGWGYLWYFLLAPIAGSFTAWGLHRLIHDERFTKFHGAFMEFVGTFYITFALCVARAGPGGVKVDSTGQFIAIGTLVAVLTYVGMHKKSGQYNPIYSIAMLLNGGQSGKDVGIYAGAQCSGSFLAALIGYLITRYGSSDGQTYLDNGGSPIVPYHPVAASNEDKFGALLAELFYTFIVTFTYLMISSRVHKEGHLANPWWGIIIGWSVLAGMGSVGIFTNSISNPAVWLGSSLIYLFSEGGDDVGEIYIYAISGTGGCLAAAFLYKFIFGPGFEGDHADSELGRVARERETMRDAASRRKTGGAGAGGNDGKGATGAGAAGAGAASPAVTTYNPAGSDALPANQA